MAETVRIEIPIVAQDKTDPAVSNAKRNLDNLGKAAQKINQSMGNASGSVSKFDKQAQKTQKTLQSWMKEKWQIALEAKDKISPLLKTLKTGLSGIAGKTWNITMKAVDLATAPIRGIFNLLRNPIVQAGGILGISLGLKDTVDTYKGFEAAMSQVQAVSGATSGELEKLTAKAQTMGATTKFTATESAEAFNYMAMAGWKTEDMLNGIEGILNLAAASGSDLATTSDIVTDVLTAFKMEAKDAGHFSDVLAAASSNANTNVNMMGETFKYAASMAGSLGYSIEDVALLSGLMANAGIKSSMAGTALNSIFTRLATNTKGARDEIEKLGISFYDEHGKANDLSDIFDQLRIKTKDFTDEERSMFAKTVAGTSAQKGLLAILNASEKDYRKLTEAVNHADGASERMAETMLNNLAGSLTLLQSAVDGAKIQLGGRLAPYIRSFADSITAHMPEIQNGIDSFMDWFDGKVTDFQTKLGEITGSEEFQNADLFGKAQILWDEIIATPFHDWWNSTGKQIFADAAKDIGKGLGSGIKTGILMLLGIDVSGALDDGVSIGASFSKGFAEGFDFKAISGKLKEALVGLLGNAGKLLPGGQAPDLSSVLSAALLAKIASPMISMGKGGFQVGKAIFGSQGGGQSLASWMMGSAGSGTGLLGTGAMTAINLGAGNLAGGASLGAGALAGIGLASIAGGAIGAGSGISGLMDVYKASKETDKDRKAMLQASGGMKVGGALGGAAAGAAIGSVVPVLGTAAGALIGAGVGGIAGMIGAKKKKQEYEEQVRLAEEAAEAEALIAAKAAVTGRNVETAKFRTKELNDAMNDANVSVTDMAKMFSEAVSKRNQEAFGNIVLSAEEIKSLAESITFGDQAESLVKFQNAAAQAQKTMGDFAADYESLDKLNWRAQLGFAMSDDDLTSYQNSVDSFIQDASDYIDDKHYEGTLSMKLIMGDDYDTTSLDSAYESIRGKMEELGTQLSEKTEIYLQDGVLTLDEETELANLQTQISDIMNRLNEADTEAKFDAMKIKYGGSHMSEESFAALQEELAANVKELETGYGDAMTIDLKNLRLQLSEGAINEEEFEAAKAEIERAYNEKMSDLNLRVENFQLETIAEAYGSSLDGILPGLGETTSEKLAAAMEAALATKPDVSGWTTEDVVSMFGLDAIDAETAAAVAEKLQAVAESVPESVKSQLSTGITDGVNQTDLSGAYAGLTTLRESVASQAQAEFSTPIDIKQQVNITYTTTEFGKPSPSSLFSGSTSAPNWRFADHNANGGFTNGAELSWIGEDGPEAIIPLGRKRHGRGVELWEQVGKILGISGHADGGIFPTEYDAQNALISALGHADENTFTDADTTAPQGHNEATTGNGGSIRIEVSMNPVFEISGASGQDEEGIVSVLRKHIKEMADEMGGEIAERLFRVYENMPVKGV